MEPVCVETITNSSTSKELEYIRLSGTFVDIEQYCNFLKASAVIRVTCNVQYAGE